MINDTDKAYAAGYFDGDGCFYLSKPQRKFISSMIIVSTDKNILIWFKSLWGGKINTSKKVPDQKTVYRLEYKKRESIYFAQDIQFFLKEKFDQANLFIGFSISDNKDVKMRCIDEIRYIKKFDHLAQREFKQQFESVRNTIKPSEEDYAYLAGFIDAECCLGIQKNKPKNKPNHTYKIMLSCNNTKAPVFKWLLERFGGTINFIDRASKYPTYRNQLRWNIYAKKLGEILDKIHPYLKYKKPVCEELMKFYKTTIPVGTSRKTDAFRQRYAIVLQEREKIVHNVHILNLKGTK